MVEAGEVAGERVPGARIRLAVGHTDSGGVDLAAGGEVAALEFVAGRVVVGWLLDRGAIGGPGHAKAEAVALDAVVGVAVFAGQRGLDAVDQTARGVARTDVGVDAFVELLVFAVELQAVGRLAILDVAFTADREAQAGEGQQVAFVGRIDEDLALDDGTVLTGDRDDLQLLHRHAVLLLEPMPAEDRDLRFFDPSIVASQSAKVGEKPVSVADPLLLERSDAEIELFEIFGK